MARRLRKVITRRASIARGFYSKLKGNITRDEYDKFVQDFDEPGCKTMMDWLKVHNEANVIPFIEAVNKTRKQYYPDEINMLNDAVSIPGISMTYILNKSLKMKQPGESPRYLHQVNLVATSARSAKLMQNLAVKNARK